MSSVSATPTNPTPAFGDSDSAIRVVTVAYHCGEGIRGLLQSLATASSRSIHAVVVDNSEAPDPAVVAACQEFGAEYRSLPNNPGFGAGSNFGSDFGGTEPWLVFANPDLRLTPGAVDALIAAAAAHPEAALIGPALVDETGTRYPTGRSFPYISIGIGHALLGRVWPGNPWTRRYWGSSWRGTDSAAVDWLSGACILLRRADWEQLGGFDPAYFMYFEDMDLAWRARRFLGRGALFVGNAVAIHEQGATTGDKTLGAGAKRNLRALRAHHDSARIFLNRLYAGRPSVLPLLRLISWGLRLRYWVLARH
ncbi:glycosyltransferase family 2 protein [Mobiluncus curtisii]|uniref:glycosyltransferase n=1 Tax=Mobiluncus curtisii TaxID=2051 RepID=UPI00146FD310|nr:glycosyltransferase family 2 protein [Mobiluncus curtisii]NMW88761.1 glycosyltransferase family 2 protein [Mobiluncus curtisii]